MKSIAFFDFDGTITHKDTLIEFIRYAHGRKSFWMGFLLYSPYLILYRLGLLSNQIAKEKILAHFFGNYSVSEFNSLCQKFAEKQVPLLVRPKALAEIEKHQEQGTEVVIVTASAENWVSLWCKQYRLDCIGTRMICAEDRISGKIDGANCYGEEKVNRIRINYDLSSYDRIYCYGDTKGDLPMLELATIRFYKPFR